MSLDFEAVKNYGEEMAQEKEMLSGVTTAPPPEASTAPSIDLSFLTAKTGSGSIEDYILHPLNFGGSRGMAQILRGCTGIAGDLDLALIDIVIGGFNLFAEGRKKHAVD